YKKKFWVLSQNMSKAYNSIHIPTLKLALLRLKVPTPIVDLITDIFSACTNTVITLFSTTSPYSVHDGINQDETITPYCSVFITTHLLAQLTHSMKATH